jgi:hypothetical protein
MGNSFNKIDNEINQNKIENYDTVDSLDWNETEQFVDTVDSLGWNDTVNSYNQNIDSENTATSSPFISTELYNKIMNKNDHNLMQGGYRKKNLQNTSSSLNIEFTEKSSSSSDSDSNTSSTDTSELSQMLSLTSDYKGKKSQTGSSIEAYGFSNTSSELSQKFVINSDTSISKIDNSSSINTSDINLVTIDKSDSEINLVSSNSVNGKRYL